ncbi:MAG: NnrS family protein, partial [Alphaproteobacteria bacterium]
FMLLGVAALSDGIAQGDAIHALTAGAAGTMILAVMSRAILGHTGNVLHADRVTALAYCFVSVAALARLAVIALPDWGPQFYSLSGGAWILAFGLFVWRYGPISIRG